MDGKPAFSQTFVGAVLVAVVAGLIVWALTREGVQRFLYPAASAGNDTTPSVTLQGSKHDESPAQSDTSPTESSQQATAQDGRPARADGSSLASAATTVILHTTAGAISVRLFTDTAPQHAHDFISRAQSGFYDAVQFSRVVSNALVEAGHRAGAPVANEYHHPEISDVTFRRGVVGMSTSGTPLREDWKFFIVTNDAPYLDGVYTAIGEVTSDMSVVDEIAKSIGEGKSPWIMSIDVR